MMMECVVPLIEGATIAPTIKGARNAGIAN